MADPSAADFARLLDAVECIGLDVSELTSTVRDLVTLLEAFTGMSRYGYPLSSHSGDPE